MRKFLTLLVLAIVSGNSVFAEEADSEKAVQTITTTTSTTTEAKATTTTEAQATNAQQATPTTEAQQAAPAAEASPAPQEEGDEQWLEDWDEDQTPADESGDDE